jgi:hypothetical protein
MNTLYCSRLSSRNSACPASYIRFFNAWPCEAAVDIYVNGERLASNLGYQQFAGYFTVKPCCYRIEVLPSGKGKHGECPIAEVCFTVCPRSAMTLAVVGGCEGLLGMQEAYDPCGRVRDRCKAYVRFVNLSSNSPPLDVVISGGARLFQNVGYTTRTRYVPIDSGTYVFQLRPSGSSRQGLTMSPVSFDRGTSYTLYAVGIAGAAPPLELVSTPDGNY